MSRSSAARHSAARLSRRCNTASGLLRTMIGTLCRESPHTEREITPCAICNYTTSARYRDVLVDTGSRDDSGWQRRGISIVARYAGAAGHLARLRHYWTHRGTTAPLPKWGFSLHSLDERTHRADRCGRGFRTDRGDRAGLSFSSRRRSFAASRGVPWSRLIQINASVAGHATTANAR